MIPELVREWLKENGYGAVVAARPVGGGCINHGARLETAAGQTFFLKTNRDVPPDMFAREAEGLEALRQAGGPRAPQPLLHGPDFLLLEDLSPAAVSEAAVSEAAGRGYWPEFGRQMAALHAHTRPQFGFHHDNYIGSTPQPNPWTDDGYAFFAGQRLSFQAGLARRGGYFGKAEAGRVERLAGRLPELVPPQPASLIHGDLWSGNAISGPRGEPAIIDPAAYYGWAEADLAMTALFGAFPEAFYRAYQEARPLEPGWRERFPLYNLYHLLNHLNLFGEGYKGQVLSILRRYS